MVMITDKVITDAGLTYKPASEIGMSLMHSLYRVADADWQGTFPLKSEWTVMRTQTLDDLKKAFQPQPVPPTVDSFS